MLSRCQTARNGLQNVLIRNCRLHRSYATSTNLQAKESETRNIGIIAHIDAGKTTTTERMLYYAGFTRQLGDVDEGSTITDFLPAERARGITIQSAAITFQWPPQLGPAKPTVDTPRSSRPHTINLIDTPGHADFTFEVIRSLRVLDGAVCILDGVAGVEAQTEKVWSQASAYQIPKIIFVNKLDRDGATFARSVQEVGARLNVWPAVCGIPWWDEHGSLKGVGDVVSLRALEYPAGGDGKDIKVYDHPQLETQDSAFAMELQAARTAIVELIAEHDDNMVEKFLEADESHMSVKAQDIRDSLRQCTLQYPQRIVPVFAGASFRNVGVQPLLDGVVDLLPSNLERPDPEVSFGTALAQDTLSAFLSGQSGTQAKQSSNPGKSISKARATLDLTAVEACALAFKVVSDARKGVLVYVRVYSGSIRRNALLWNTNLQLSERAQRLLRMYANDAVDIEEIQAGHIGVIPGLKHTRTGDSLVVYRGANPKNGPPAPVSQLLLKPIEVPPPVFFVSVEPNSLSEERHVRESLELLLREDPSLSVSTDEESGQTHLAGMGELHLEIARDRLVQDLKAKARIGSIEISYREAISTATEPVSMTYEREVSGRMSKASCRAAVEPLVDGNDAASGTVILPDSNILVLRIVETVDDGDDSSQHTSLFSHAVIKQALQTGVLAALARGPTYGYPVHSTKIVLDFDPATDVFASTTTSSISSAARLAVAKALKSSASESPVAMMEPVMRVAISVDEGSMGSVVQDLSSARGGNVLSLDAASDSEQSSEQSTSTVDVSRIYTPPDPFGSSGVSRDESRESRTMRIISARVPLKEMVGYLKHLRSFTAGRGTFTMTVDKFEKMNSQRTRAVLGRLQDDAL